MGGAALVLQGQRDSATRDIDVSTPLAPEVTCIIDQIARRRQWPANWINDAVKMWTSHYDSPGDWEVYADSNWVTISIATTRLLLAMKLYACRGRRDIDDITTLFEACGVTSKEEALSVFDKYYPNEAVNDRARDLISSHFES